MAQRFRFVGGSQNGSVLAVEMPTPEMELRIRPKPWEPHDTYVFGDDGQFHYQPQYGPGSPDHNGKAASWHRAGDRRGHFADHPC